MAQSGARIHIYGDYDGAGVKKAQQDLGMFERQAQGFGGAISKSMLGVGAAMGGAFAIGNLVGNAVDFMKQAAEAAIEDEKSVIKLKTALGNLGQGFQDAKVEAFVSQLQKLYGVADTDLRSAFQTLVTATGDVTQSQYLLQTALDASAATGKDLAAVSMAIAKASTGQVSALKRLGIPLDENIVKAKDFGAAIELMNAKFGGQAAAAANTYAGKLARVQQAADEAQETIGYALVGAMDRVATSMGGTGGAADAMGAVADIVADLITGLGVATESVIDFVNATGLLGDTTDGNSGWGNFVSGLLQVGAMVPGVNLLVAGLGALGSTGDEATKAMAAQAAEAEGLSLLYAGYAANANKAHSATAQLAKEEEAAAEAAQAEADAMKRLKDEADALRRSLDLLYGNADNVTTSIRAAGKAAREAKGDLTSNKDAAIELRSAFGDGAEAILAFAQATGTSARDTLRIWDEQVARLRANLIKNGVKPKDVDAFINKNLWQTRFMLLADVIGKGPAAEAMRLSGLALGRNAWQGIVDALNSQEARNAVYGAASSLGGRVNAGAAAALEEASPSRTMYRIGVYATEGLALGIKSGGEAVSKASALVAGQAAKGAREVIDGQVSQWKGVLDSAISSITSMAGGVRDQVMGQLDFSLTDAEGKPLTTEQIVQSLFGGLTQMGEVVKQVSTSIGAALPPELLNKILAMPPDTAIALAKYFSENPALLAQLTTGYQKLSDDTLTLLGTPMGVAWAQVGTESAAKLLEQATAYLEEHKGAWKRWVRENLGVTVDVGVNYVRTGDLPGRANGGAVSAGGTYLVGERGPELITMGSSSGTVTPNRSLGGGGSTVNVTVNAGVGANGYEIGRQVVDAIKKYERVAGPVFAAA